MCQWGDDVMLEVPTKSDGSETKVIGVDRCIAPIVDALNARGIYTLACCCGHGKAPGVINLHDGRSLHIEAPEQTATVVEPWRTEAVSCGACSHEWVAVIPAFVPSSKLECPACKRRGT